MKTLNFEEMEKVEGGLLRWRTVLDGTLCGLGIVTAETILGAVLAGAACSLAFGDAVAHS